MKCKRTILNFILVLVLCLSFINPLILPQPTLGAEEEEEDNFTTMPNYRWENQSTTDSAVSERLIGDNYEVYNMNNETTGTQKFEKSRKLNSRDFYFESRFALDVGGNQTEYFRDEKGDACDFEEGDLESWSGLLNMEVSDGIFSGTMGVATFDALLYELYVSMKVYNSFIVRIKSNVDDLSIKLRVRTDNGLFRDISALETLDSNWQIITWTKSQNQGWQDYNIITQLRLTFNEVGGDGTLEATDQVWIDYIKLIGDLDYATHVEDEIEDTWDWEDSNEYWYTEESNVSDFNDGTTENWEANSSSTVVSEISGWLKAEKTSYGTYMDIEDASISVDASIYKHIAIELYTTKQTITSVEFLDTDLNSLYIDEDDIPINTKKLIYAEFDGDWSGTEEKLIISIHFPGALNDHNTYINMTYLYDTELGDLEAFTGFDRQWVNPNGYWEGVPAILETDTFRRIDNRHIDTDVFDILKIRIKSTQDVKFRVGGYDSGAVYHDLSDIENVGQSFVEFSFVLSDDPDWDAYDYYNRFSFAFYDDSGNLEGNEYISIDYILVSGHWSETDGFKFSLLNADDEEGMSFQFTGNADNSYNLSIDMYDSVGVALDYTYSFDYDIDVDGWLRIRVDWHLDKRNAKILFEYDNGSDIINIRRITQLYSSNLGFSRFLLLEEGFPSLCMNNSIHELAISYVMINYVDADWIIVDWKEPVGVWNFYPSHTSSQDLETYFSSISPYGVTAYHKNVSNRDHWYMLNVDRFDGLSFDWKTSTEDLDTGDWCSFVMGVYNVRRNGSLEPLFLFWTLTTDVNSYVTYFVKDVEMIERTGSYVKAEGSISIFHESSTKIILDTRYSNEENDFQGTIEVTPDDERFTKEMLFVFAYEVETDNSAATDDIVEISIGGFDLKRKDFIGDIVSAVLAPIVGIIAFLFSPFFMLFQFLVQSLMKGFRDLFAGLEPLFGVLGGIFGGFIGILQEAIGGFIDGLGTAIEGFLEDLEEGLASAFNGLWALLFGLAEQLGQFIVDIIEWLMPIIDDAFAAIIGFFAGLIFWIWAALGLPDLLAILDFVITYFGGILTSMPQIIADLATAIFLLGNLVLVLWWAWCVLLPVIANDPATAAGEIIDRFFRPLFPWDIAGFSIYFPQGIFVTAMTYFLIIAPAGGMYAIW